jgi:hypothetical protein
VIVDEKGAERTSVVGPYSEGADLALRCDVYGGKCMCHILHYAVHSWMQSSSYLMRSAFSACPRGVLRAIE